MPTAKFPRLACPRLMQLKLLADSIPVQEVLGPLDREVDGIFYDSRRVQKNGLYVAVRGAHFDGHKFTEQAIERGASAIVVERPESHSRATSLVVADSRIALADLAFTFFKKPALRLKMAGVTGTNGKTTTTFLIKHICENAGLRCGLIGTVRYEIGERVLPATRTTPESLDLQELLAQMAAAGCKAAVMEVSSHALAQERTRGLEWDVAVFTNLTQDHLDFHRTMANYFEAKARLFTGLKIQPNKKEPSAVINIDDRHGEQLVNRLKDYDLPVVTYGMSARADFRASNYRAEFSGTSFQLDARGKIYLVRVPLIGRFNVLNAMAALAAANSLGVSLRDAVLSLAKSPQVPGRLEAVPAKRQFQIFVDYAHTDDALLNVLKTLRELGPRRLIVVFGAGGDRDHQKRPLMGRVADQNADYSIITSDNPRKEDPLAIIAEVRKGFHSDNFETVPDRAEAIARAIALAQPRDIILIAGKGHETYQEFADHTIPFDDRQMALRALENRPLEF
jgi:UDP-N-acetylmuramoyl-L-alanyl-D-glutamate--2,6-diaminopimelate ligase